MEQLMFVEDGDLALASVRREGGHVTQRFTKTLWAVHLDEELRRASLQGMVEIATRERALRGDLPERDRLIVEAWGRAVESPFELRHELDGLRWDSPRLSAPLNDALVPRDEPRAGDASSEGPLRSPTPGMERVLLGNVGVGLVLVSGPGALRMPEDEQRLIVQQAMRAMSFLVAEAPRGQLSFSYDIQTIESVTPPGPYRGVLDPYEAHEKEWRDAALRRIRPAQRAAYDLHRVHADRLREDLRTDSAFVAYFTRYPLHHFAYAVRDKVVMRFDNDGWGPDALHRVFAHETCHVFGAADEYGSCSCGSYGRRAVPNHNCVNCGHPARTQEECLMLGNTGRLCEWSRGQVGW